MPRAAGHSETRVKKIDIRESRMPECSAPGQVLLLALTLRMFRFLAKSLTLLHTKRPHMPSQCDMSQAGYCRFQIPDFRFPKLAIAALFFGAAVILPSCSEKSHSAKAK